MLILNDQGGSVMDVSEDITATLRAQDHGHPPVICLSECNNRILVSEKMTETIRAECHGAHPVVCFEPGILRRDCSAGNRAYIDICSTLRAQMGDNQPAVCYALDHVITTGANCTAQGPCVYENICPTEKAGGVHAVCYAVYPGNSITSPYNGNNPQPGDPCPTLTDDSRYYLVGEKREE